MGQMDGMDLPDEIFDEGVKMPNEGTRIRLEPEDEPTAGAASTLDDLETRLMQSMIQKLGEKTKDLEERMAEVERLVGIQRPRSRR